jgi:hypothetical protein
MEHENSSAISFDSSYTRTNNIYFSILRTKHWKLHIWFFCKLQLGQKVILDLIGKMLGPCLYWDGGLLGLLCGMFLCSYFKGVLFVSLFWEFISTLLLWLFWISAFGVQLCIKCCLVMILLQMLWMIMWLLLCLFLEDYPFAFILNIIAIILIAGFFVTSSDSDLW